MAIEDETAFLWRGLGYKEPKKFTIRPCCMTLKHASFHIRAFTQAITKSGHKRISRKIGAKSEPDLKICKNLGKI